MEGFPKSGHIIYNTNDNVWILHSVDNKTGCH